MDVRLVGIARILVVLAQMVVDINQPFRSNDNSVTNFS
jgi:hypothetical protein